MNFEWWNVFIFIHHTCIHCDIVSSPVQSLLKIGPLNVTFNLTGILSGGILSVVHIHYAEFAIG